MFKAGIMTVVTSIDKQKELQQQIPPTQSSGVNEDVYTVYQKKEVKLFPPKAISSLFLSTQNQTAAVS